MKRTITHGYNQNWYGRVAHHPYGIVAQIRPWQGWVSINVFLTKLNPLINMRTFF